MRAVVLSLTFVLACGASPGRAEFGLEPGGFGNPGGYREDGHGWRGYDSNARWGGPVYVGDAYGVSRPIYGTYALSHSHEGFIPSIGDRPVTVVTKRRLKTDMPWEGYYGGRSYDWHRR